MINADDPLSLSQVSFNSLVHFQRYAPDKLFIAKMKKESNYVNTVGRVVILAFCYSPHCPLSVFQDSLNYLQYVERFAKKSLTLTVLYQCLKFRLISEILSRQKCDG